MAGRCFSARTAFNELQNLNEGYLGAQKREQLIAESKFLFDFALSVYTLQARRCRYFLHAHPATALFWRWPEFEKILAMHGFSAAVDDACMLGMTARDPSGQGGAL